MSRKDDAKKLIEVFSNLESYFWDNLKDDESKVDFFVRFVNAKESSLQEFNNGLKDLKSLVMILKSEMGDKDFKMITDKLNMLEKYVKLLFNGTDVNISLDLLNDKVLSNFFDKRKISPNYFSFTERFTTKAKESLENKITINDEEVSTNTVTVKNGFIVREFNEMPWYKRNRICLGSLEELKKMVKLKGSNPRAKGILLMIKEIVRNEPARKLINAVIVLHDVDFNKEVIYKQVEDSNNLIVYKLSN